METSVEFQSISVHINRANQHKPLPDNRVLILRIDELRKKSLQIQDGGAEQVSEVCISLFKLLNFQFA